MLVPGGGRAVQGKLDGARQPFERQLDLGNDIGLLSEEYDPTSHRQLGNFPQAFTHLPSSTPPSSSAEAAACDTPGPVRRPSQARRTAG